MNNKGLLIGLGIIIVIVFLAFSWGKGVYNSMVTQDEAVKTAWSQVENQYQRRADLIPNLVNTVKGYAAHERETLEAVINARANATKTTIDPSNLNPESLQQFQAAQGQLSSALSRLMVVIERYPDLKANENFKDCRLNWKGRKTASRSNACASTRLPSSITPISGASPIHFWPVFSGSSSGPISPLTVVLKERLQWTSALPPLAERRQPRLRQAPGRETRIPYRQGLRRLHGRISPDRHAAHQSAFRTSCRCL